MTAHPHTATTQLGPIVNGLVVDHHEVHCVGMDEDGNWLGRCDCFEKARKCRICHEPVSEGLPFGDGAGRWFHTNTRGIYCYTGDGSWAYPEDVMFDVEIHFTVPALDEARARSWVVEALGTVMEEGMPDGHDWWSHEDSVKEVPDGRPFA